MTLGPTVGSVNVEFGAKNDRLKRIARESMNIYQNVGRSFREQAQTIGNTARQWERATTQQEKHTQAMRHGLPTWKEVVKVFDDTAGQLGVVGALAPTILSAFQGLAAGGGALVAGLAPLAGTAAAGAVGITTLAQGAGVLELALKDVTKTANPLHSALDRMTKDVGVLEEVAKQTTLPTFAKSVDRVRTLMPLAAGAVRATGRELASLADEGSRMMASGPWRRDFATVAGANVGIIRSLGHGGLFLADALRNVVAEAAPMALEFAHMAERGAKTVDVFIRNARASGDLSRFFHDTVDVTSTLLHSLANLGVGLVRVLAPGKDLGTDMLHSFEKLTAQFRAWTGTAEGQRKINEFFSQGRATLEQLGSFLQIAAKHAGGFLVAATQIGNVVSSILDNVPGLKSFVGYWVTLGTLIKITSLGSMARGFKDLVVGIQSGIRWLISLRVAEEAAGDAALVMAAKQQAAATAAGGAGLAGAIGRAGGSGLLGSLGGVATAMAVLVPLFNVAKDSIKHNTSIIGELTGSYKHNEGASKGVGSETDKLAQSWVAAANQVNALTDKQYQAAGAAATFRGELAKQRTAIKEWSDEAVTAAASFQGSLSHASKVSASDVLKSLRSQRDNTRTFMHDVNVLIAHGFSPDAIKQLSKQGPEYVHALATGSGSQMALAKRLMHDQNVLIHHNWASIVDKMARKQAEGAAKIVHNQQANMGKYSSTTARELNNTVGKFRESVQSINAATSHIQDEKIGLSMAGSGKVTWSAQATEFKFRAGRMAAGGRINMGTTPTADDVLVRASKGETMVSARDSADPWFRSWAAMKGIPGYASGGLITKLNAGQALAWSRMVSEQANRMGHAAADIIGKNAAQALAKHGDEWAGSLFPGIVGGGVHGSGSWRIATDYLTRHHIPFGVISTFRPGARTHASGRVSFHALNRAVDLVGNFMQIWSALTHTHPTELIYSRAPYYIARGRAKPIGMLDPITRADHYNHVHAAYDRGGVLPPGRSVVDNFTGAPETVLGPGATVRLHPDDIKALAQELSRMPINLDGRRVDAGLNSSHQLNARRRGP